MQRAEARYKLQFGCSTASVFAATASSTENCCYMEVSLNQNVAGGAVLLLTKQLGRIALEHFLSYLQKALLVFSFFSTESQESRLPSSPDKHQMVCLESTQNQQLLPYKNLIENNWKTFCNRIFSVVGLDLATTKFNIFDIHLLWMARDR